LSLRLVVLLAAAAAVCAAAEPNQLTPQERAQGWRLLFDGKSSAGWVEVTGKPFPANCWAIENACLKAIPRDNGFQDIRTVETFRSFELEWDWMMNAKGNSGVKYLIQRVDDWNNKQGRQARARGLEYQLADDANDDAASAASRVAGALYSIFAPEPKIVPKIGGFNHSRLVVDGDRVEHWLNGAKVVEFRLDAPEVQKLFPGIAPKESAISLQNHQSEAWFRSIKIRVHP
jgi:3-keto-disaccharide hydrolase